MKILLSAFACDPVQGSEPYVGWSWANGLSAEHGVVVITRTRNLDHIRAHGARYDFEIVDFDLPFWRKRDNHRYIAIHYVLWQVLAFFKVWGLCRKHKFDLIHHLTYNAIDLPGLLHFIPGPRFIWGPVGGGQVPPESLKVVYGSGWPRQKWRALRKTFAAFNPLVLFAAKKADHVFFANRETAARLARHCRSWSALLETAIEIQPPLPDPNRTSGKALWLGKVLDRKALMLAIDAFARALTHSPGLATELIVAGDGPLLASAQRQAEALGIAGRIAFLGRVPLDQVPSLIDDCDFMVFSSVQDTSGNVVLEAMARGKPVIALDHQGAGEIIEAGCGVKIPVADYDTVVAGFADAITRLSSDAPGRREMGRRALELIAAKHSWHARIHAYNEVLNRLEERESAQRSLANVA